MGGFLGGLRDLLGGFADVKQIDKGGFDWREKRAQEEFLRQRQRDQAGQQDEERMLGQLSDVLAGQEGEPDAAGIESQIPGQVDGARRKWLAQVAMGRLPERKSSLEAAKAYNQTQRDERQGTRRIAEIGARGDESAELLRLRSKLETDQPLTPYEKERIRVLDESASARRAGGGGSGSGAAGGRTTFTKVNTSRNGQAGTLLINSRTGEERFEPAATTAATRGKEEAKGSAMRAYDRLMTQYDSMGGQPTGGIQARGTGLVRSGKAAAGYAPEVAAYKAGVRGFVPLIARALGHVGVLTELDVERTENLFPGPGNTDEEKLQKKSIIEDIMAERQPFAFSGGGKPVGYMDESGAFSSMGGSPATPTRERQTMPPSTAGPGEIRTFGGVKYRLKPGADQRLRSSWEVVP